MALKMLGSLLNPATRMNSVLFPSGNHSPFMETAMSYRAVSITPRSSAKAFTRISCNAGSMVPTRERAMDVERVLHMNGGEGETSYATSSTPQVYFASSPDLRVFCLFFFRYDIDFSFMCWMQRATIYKAKPFVQKAVVDFCAKTCPEKFTIADMGCSTGPNSLVAISHIVDAVNTFSMKTGRSPPEFQILLNDLAGTDFNTIFKSCIPDFHNRMMNKDNGTKHYSSGSCFFAGIPGSFYGRVFPRNSLCFVHSSSSVHWLSQIPEGIEGNKSNVCITKTSPDSVCEAYLKQHQKDFTLFLKARSEEVIPGGCMAITMSGRRGSDPKSEQSGRESTNLLHMLGKSLNDLVSQGIIEESKLNSFNMPLYFPSIDEVKAIVQAEGSFTVDTLDTVDVRWDSTDSNYLDSDYGFDKIKIGLATAKHIRAGTEPILTSHFGAEVIDDIFIRYAANVAEHLETENSKHCMLTICMTKKE